MIPSGWELIVVLVVILLLFGGAKLPKLARSLGQAQNEFKKGIREGAVDDDDEPVIVDKKAQRKRADS